MVRTTNGTYNKSLEGRTNPILINDNHHPRTFLLGRFHVFCYYVIISLLFDIVFFVPFFSLMGKQAKQ